jgi:adenylate kinase
LRVIALTGVPGTGKTTLADHVDDVSVLGANDLAREVDALGGHDDDRQAEIVDEAALAEGATDAYPEGPVLVEGHLAHHCPADLVVLLRCHPDELRDRLATKGWSEAKIEENAMAETLDALVPEIEQRPAGELDTTDTEPARLAQTIEALFEDGGPEAVLDPLGTTDWTPTLEEGPP